MALLLWPSFLDATSVPWLRQTGVNIYYDGSMHIPAELVPVIQISLPIVIAIFGAAWLQNKRVDDLRADLGAFRAEIREERAEIRADLKAIQEELARHGERLTRLEDRIPPLVRR